MKVKQASRGWNIFFTLSIILVAAGLLFNLWFINNTDSIIESLVSSQSKGKLHLHLKRSKFYYFSKKLELFGADFYSADSATASTAYNFKVEKLELKLKSFWSFLLYRELLIDSIHLKLPDVTVTRLRKSTKTTNNNVSITEEVGKIYNSILDALEVLEVKRFGFDGGRFTLINKISARPFLTSVSNIDFHINNLSITTDSTTAKKFLSSEDVVLRVKDQNIALPDGIHKMSFKNLLVNVGQKHVEVDSCWVRAENPNNRNAFHIFFDALKMVNLDFDALYASNLIKADSVYITNPNIELALDIKKKKEKNKKIELDTIIQQFTGNLNLGFIGVQNAAVNIIANRGDTATTFSSKNDNFQMHNLRINRDSSRKVYVERFAMVLRKYETYSRDSSTLYRFDSLQFNNNTVRLSHFTIQSINNNSSKARLYYSIPSFELTGLSWEDLLFDRYLSASKATLINPQIQYAIVAPKKKNKKIPIFKILSGLNESISLQQIEIRNGNVNIQLPGHKNLNLQQVNLVLASNKILELKSYTGMKQAIDKMAFSRAVFTTSNLRAELVNLQYSDHLFADELRVTNNNNSLNAIARKVTLNDLVWNSDDRSVFVDNLQWQQANINIKPGMGKAPKGDVKGSVLLKNLLGKNTVVTVNAKGKTITTRLDKIKIDELTKQGAAAAVLRGFTADGSSLHMQAPTYVINGGTYHLIDGGNAFINNVSFLQQTAKDTISINAPAIHFNTRIADLLQGRLNFDALIIKAPVINYTSLPLMASLMGNLKSGAVMLPYFSIHQLSFTDPVLNYYKKDTATTSVNWSKQNMAKGLNHWTFYNLQSNPKANALQLDKADITGNNFLFTTAKGQQYGVDSGFVQIILKNIKASNNGSWQWSGQLEEAFLKNPMSVALKNKSGFGFDVARLRHLTVSSQNINNIYRLLQNNPALQLNLENGSYASEINNFKWQQLQYNQLNQSLSIDSFSYSPVLTKDSFIAKAPGQTDYINALSKNIQIQNIDFTAFEKDSTFKAGKITVNGTQLDVYRDKRKPYISKGLKPLPVLALAKLPAKISIDTIQLKNTTIAYTELNEKTGQEGTITINRLNADLFPFRNINHTANDSLSIHAEGYIMDSAWVRLRLKEAYQDSLGTFVMTMRMKPADLSILNPVLMPLASIKIVSGTLDTVNMRAIGHEYFSLGDMQLNYKDLKIQFLKKGTETKKTLLTGLITFAANNFIIRKNNVKRTGTVYFLRNRDRSFFNFLIKSTLSGVASSVGAKKNKKYYRQYKKQQKLYRLPSIENE